MYYRYSDNIMVANFPGRREYCALWWVFVVLYKLKYLYTTVNMENQHVLYYVKCHDSLEVFSKINFQ